MHFELRAWRDNDLENLVQVANNFNIAKYLNDQFPHPYTEEDGKLFIESANSHSPQQIFAIDIAGKASGGIGIHPLTLIHRRNAELGYWLAQSYWGLGIMQRALKQMVKYAFENFDIDRVFARPFGNNVASQKALLKAGFILEAKIEKCLIKYGDIHDELIYGIRREQ